MKKTTRMASVEAYLNSRPLVHLSDDPSDLESLTPTHVLIGRSLLSLPELGYSGINPTLLKH